MVNSKDEIYLVSINKEIEHTGRVTLTLVYRTTLPYRKICDQLSDIMDDIKKYDTPIEEKMPEEIVNSAKAL